MTVQPAANPSATCDVLIVEDNAFLCDMMASYLTRQGLSVRTASGASIALGLLEKVTPRVAVLDYHLPGKDGVQLAQAFRELALDLPIIMMSADMGGPEQETLKRLGVRLFVHKPVPLAPLHQAIVRLLR